MQPRTQTLGPKILSGRTVIDELIRNMELGQFELAYTVLLPCVFRVYLHPDDHARLAGVVNLIVEDASRALRRRVSELNRRPSKIWPSSKSPKEFKIACRDWIIEFFPGHEVPPGDVEIHSELNEDPQPGYRGVKTTLTDREPSVTSHRQPEQPKRDGPPIAFMRKSATKTTPGRKYIWSLRTRFMWAAAATNSRWTWLCMRVMRSPGST